MTVYDALPPDMQQKLLAAIGGLQLVHAMVEVMKARPLSGDERRALEAATAGLSHDLNDVAVHDLANRRSGPVH